MTLTDILPQDADPDALFDAFTSAWMVGHVPGAGGGAQIPVFVAILASFAM